MARAAGRGAQEIARVLKTRAARLAFLAALAWLANWSAHAAMALERPLGVYGAICGSPPAQAPDACPVCEGALAASAGPLAIPDVFPGFIAPNGEASAIRAQPLLARELLADASARAPPRL